ncbi:MAG: LCP family protein [Eubacterium sp.]|nr:LCP family protein [Eubacterium sp.]
MSDKYNIDDILSEVKKRREENEKELKVNSEPEAEATETQELTLSEEPAAKETPVPEEEPKDEEPAAEEAPEPAEEEEGINLSERPEEMFEITETGDEPSDGEEKELTPEERSAKKQSRVFKIVVAVLVVLIALAVAGAVVANNWLNTIKDNSKDTVATTEQPWEGMKELHESFEPINETEADELSSLEDMIKTWYYNGTPCSSTHVLNVLLIGEDTRGDEILEEGTRADSAIIVSVNIDTKQITLTSILRDSWAYWETVEGEEDSGKFGKINGAMSSADVNAYINCLENLYKIKIDNYAIVNFSSFEKIVDKLGGVTLTLTDEEIEEINNHPKRYGDVYIEKTFEGEKGKQELNGKQALAYCRIRKIDTDNARADRQKTCLIQIFKQTKKASTARLLGIVKALIPYVKTGFGKSEIIQISRYAFSQGWLDYKIVTESVPQHNLEGGSYPGMFGGQWIWRADFPADAYIVQSRIYGKTSITLAKRRVDTAQVRQEGFFKEGDSPTTATYINENYGEVTTLKNKEKKKDSETTEEE